MSTLSFDWAVIGAGPAGIAAVGKLLDQGVKPKTILWLDPEFKVGDFGTKWRKVSSNTKVKLFTRFYHACDAFKYNDAPHHAIKQTDPESTCLLSLAAEPLQWITDHLKKTVHAVTEKVLHLKLFNQYWHLTLKDKTLLTRKVILATGSEPKSLSFPDIHEIHLQTALNPDQLVSECQPEDVIAVFGSSHSAIIIIKTLLEECRIKKVINYYLEPLRYAVYYDDWILFDDTGLKGKTAEWAREHIDGKMPDKLERVISSQENLQMTLPLCTKAIYATGFQKRLISIEGMKTLEYDQGNGIIAPGLFGVGIAFPEAKLDRHGTLEYRVGLWKFMDYLNNIMPVWLSYQ